jgi:hypothetical protein
MLAALVGAAVVVGGDLRAQLRPTELPPPQTTPPDIVIGATVAQRQEAARRLVPLLKAVQTHAQPTATVRPGSVPNSPFTGTQTTLFAFTFSKRNVPVEPRVITAMNRLLDWNVGASGHEAEARLFDRWLVELQTRSAAAVRLSGGGLCDLNCVVARMTTLDESWGSSPKGRDDARDELLLDALTAAVKNEKEF